MYSRYCGKCFMCICNLIILGEAQHCTIATHGSGEYSQSNIHVYMYMQMQYLVCPFNYLLTKC